VTAERWASQRQVGEQSAPPPVRGWIRPRSAGSRIPRTLGSSGR
jgi:hypothetical protein